MEKDTGEEEANMARGRAQEEPLCNFYFGLVVYFCHQPINHDEATVVKVANSKTTH